MKRYIYLLFVFREKIHEILGHEYPGDQGDWLPCSRENPLSTLCVLLVSNFPGILPAKLYLVLYILATKAIGCLGG